MNTTTALQFTLPKSHTHEECEETASMVSAAVIAGEIALVAVAQYISVLVIGGVANAYSITLGIFLWVVLQIGCDTYRWENIIKRQISIRSLLNALPWFVIMLGFTSLHDGISVPKEQLIYAAGLMGISVATYRFSLKRVCARTLSSLKKDIIVLGWNDQAAKLEEHLRKDVGSMYRIAACIPSVSQSQSGEATKLPPHVANIPSLNYLEKILQSGRFGAVLTVDFDIPEDRLLWLHRICSREMVEFMLAPNFMRILLSGLHVEAIGGVPLMKRDRLPLRQPLNRVLKRTVDIFGSIVGLVLSAPIIALFGFLVYRESPGPIFFRQVRIGKNGRPFEIIKIRSMRINAEKEKAGFSTKDDPRRLKIGALMRKLNIDEVPQFWNVLKGEMSLVGPRPERPELICDFKHEIENYNLRHSVKPGLSGWAQINGWRGDTDLLPRIQHDLEYVERWNLWLDIYIMIKTFTSRQNAY